MFHRKTVAHFSGQRLLKSLSKMLNKKILTLILMEKKSII